MTGARNGRAPELGGKGREETADNGGDIAYNDRENQAINPEVDLLSWMKLSAGVKPSRADRKPKRAWKRRASR
jgi:hypothetical protein